MKYYNGPKRRKNYFEGWYFKHISRDLNIAFIPSISITNLKNKTAFIQVISTKFTEKFEFPFESFSASKNNLDIKIGNNHFTDKGINLHLKNEEYDIKVNLRYSSFLKLKNDIMGPFKHLPKMECKHNVFSMKHHVNGIVTINNEEYEFTYDLGYIEGDYGVSFPKKYIWMQANNFNCCSFFLSIATIPYLKINFTGLISSLIIGKKEYRFATYNFSKIIIQTNDHIKIKKGKLILDVYLKNSNRLTLAAPKNGNMTREVYESMDAVIEIILSRNNNIIYQGISNNASIEIG